VPEDVDPGQGGGHGGVAQVGAGVEQLGMRPEGTAGDRAHPPDAGVGQEGIEDPAADVAGGPRQARIDLAGSQAGISQAGVDRTTSKASRAAVMSASLCVAITDARRIARPACTAGGTAQFT
jgi:hypothetical protein